MYRAPSVKKLWLTLVFFFFFQNGFKTGMRRGEQVNGFTWLKLYTISLLKRLWLEVFACSGVLIAQLSSSNSTSTACMGDELSRRAKNHSVFLYLATCDMTAIQRFIFAAWRCFTLSVSWREQNCLLVTYCKMFKITFSRYAVKVLSLLCQWHRQNRRI